LGAIGSNEGAQADTVKDGWRESAPCFLKHNHRQPSTSFKKIPTSKTSSVL